MEAKIFDSISIKTDVPVEIANDSVRNEPILFPAIDIDDNDLRVGEPVENVTIEKLPGKPSLILIFGILLLAFILFSKKKKKVGKIQREDVMTFVLIAGVFLSFDMIKKILESVGIWKDKATKTLDSAMTNPDDAFNPNFYKQYSNFNYAISTAQAEAYAKRIYDSFGFFNDCEECVKAVFYEMKTKSNVSFLSEVFQTKYGKALLPFLRGGVWPQDRLSDSDVAEIYNYVQKLPNN